MRKGETPSMSVETKKIGCLKISMEALEREYCVMECGEEQLDECQEKFYRSKLNDFDELLQLFVNSHLRGTGHIPVDSSSPKMSSASPDLENLLSQPVESTPKPRPLVVLDPATLNQLATSNGYRVASSSANNNPPFSAGGHSLPALAPNFRPTPQRTVTTTRASVPQGMITLSSMLNESPCPPRQGPRMRFPAPSPLQPVHIPGTPSPIPPPQVRGVSQPRIRAPLRQAPMSSGSQAPPPRPPPPPYANSQVRVTTPSPSTNGIALPSGPQSRFPPPPPPPAVPSRPCIRFSPRDQYQFPPPAVQSGPHVPIPAPVQYPPPPTPKDRQVQNLSLIDEMKRQMNQFPEGPEPHGNCVTGNNTSSKNCLPPSNLPLLPETRPETASDSRPRPRPGPASRTQRLPSVPSSPDSLTSSDMVDLTQDDQSHSTAKKTSTKEKTFPSLIVTARASLKIFPVALINNERLLMDNQIRKVMQMPPSVFTEYLLQQRLLKSEQYCKEHDKPLKLGIYSDPKRFPVSGGYVWIADCCKSGFCSVYSGSVFDKTLQPPTNIIKLIYHWCCNTAVHNVLNWVKVDSYIMKTYYTFFRAICTTVVHEKAGLLGGNYKKIQVGVMGISTHEHGSTKEVKVDIMGVMDPDTYAIRLKVLDNFFSDSNKVYESKFRKILEVLKDWVHPQSTVITDFAVDLTLCREYGFSNLVVSGGKHSADNNCAVSDYMRAKIPLMFQNTLGMLSYTIIQQFLDELVWRETWGPYASRAYDCMVEQLAELTKLPGPDLITKLKRIASEPTKDWKYSVWKEEGAPKSAASFKGAEPVPYKIKSRQNEETRNYKISSTEDVKNRVSSAEEKKGEKGSEPTDKSLNSVDPAVAVPMSMIPLSQQNANDKKIFLEPFYYGTVDGDKTRQKRSGSFLAECVLCKRDFLSASSFTNHLIHHALNSRVVPNCSDQLLSVCTLCCKAVGDIDCHRKESHPYPRSNFGQSYMCKICRLDLKTEEKIVKHMTFVHQELDMPYKCDLCRYQTSIYDNAATHFKDFHDKDCCVRCPYCFKIVRFCSKNGIEIPQNQYYFVQHVQKHSLNKLNRKCEKCVLSFTNMATVKQHQERVHKRSGKFLKNVRRLKYDNTQKMLIMSFPTQAHLPPVTLHESSFHTLKGKALSSSVVLPEYYAVCSCLECDGPMTQNHFSVKMTCTRCSFQSCCANSIREHSARRHYVVDNPTEQNLRSQIIGGSASLDKPLYCSYCTFSSNNGNKMAAHLVGCGDGGALATSDKRKLEAFVSPRRVQKIL